MFKLIKYSARLKIVDAILDSKISISDDLNKSKSSKVKFSYIDDRILSKSANSKVKKRRYRNGNR